MKKLLLALLIISVFTLLLIAALADPDEFSSLEGVLLWVATGGGSMILFGYVQAYLLENWKVWHSFPRWVKIIVPIIFAGLFGIVANIAIELSLMAYVPVSVQIIVLAAINWIFSQRAYKGIKEGVYAASARSGPQLPFKD